MSDAPSPYTPTTAFSSFNPSSFPNLGIQLDTELDNVSDALTETQSRLAEIQRDDGELENGIVGPDALADSVYAGVNEPTTWATATDYTVRDSVITGAVWYRCLTAHTSGTFATDLAAGYWTAIFDFTSVFSSALLSNSTPAALGGAATAGTSTQASRADHVHSVPVFDEGGTALLAEAFG